MPCLEIEMPTLMEIREQLETQNKKLAQRLTEIEDKLLPRETELPPEYQEQMDKESEDIERREKWLKEHPKEKERLEEQRKQEQKEYEKWSEEHPDEVRQIEEADERHYTRHLEDRVKELESRFQELENIIKKRKVRK